MRYLLVVIACVATASADGFPTSGPCDDLAACETACKAGKAASCQWGGVLAMQSPPADKSKDRARALFDKGCSRGDGDSCWYVAQIVDPGEGAELKDRAKART